MASEYARFYKCDLQVQTPEDSRNWDANDPIRVGNPRNEADLQDKARQFLRRCHEVDLEVIAVTDHNFAAHANERDLFLTHLIQQNSTVAREVSRDPLVIFPGFEVDIGFHLLCIFDPGTPLLHVSDYLTTLGLPPPARFVSGRPVPLRSNSQPVTCDEVLRVVQEQYGGLVIAAHAFSNDGIAKEGRDAADFCHDKLLAVEVNEVPLVSRAKEILLGNDQAWRRRRRLAYVMSSDCKKLRPANGTDFNYIGYRHTWIKMSQPSIEALRQAFLDQAHAITERCPNESRIQFGDHRPESKLNYPRILGIRISGAAFLKDQDHEFSPHLNALIGGRGAGKSSIIEYLRLSLDHSNSILGHIATSNFEKLKRTLEGSGKVEVSIQKNAKSWRLEFTLTGGPTVVEGEPIPDIARFFQTRILSQGEISELAEDRAARTRIIDDLIRSQLDDYSRQASDITRQIKLLDEKILSKPDLEGRKKILETERLDFTGKIERLKQLEQPLKDWKDRLAEQDLLESVRSQQLEICQTIESVTISQNLQTTSQRPQNDSIDSAIQRIASDFDALNQQLAQRLKHALREYKEGVAALLDSQPVMDWRTKFGAAEAGFQRLKRELLAQGTDPDAYLDYQKQLKLREDSIALLNRELGDIAELATKRQRELGKLEQIWELASDAREKISRDLTEAVPKTNQGTPFVKVSVARFGDDHAFAQKLKDLPKDRRRVSDDDWGTFDERRRAILPDDSFLARVAANTPAATSAVRTFLSWVGKLRAGEQPEGCPWTPNDRRTKALLEWCKPSFDADLSLWNQPDRVRIELYRQDGTLAGEMEEGLSVGQRCTAILALLLAQDDAPAIIDQPENDLDNEFIFRELVPLLRRIKETRQVIVATHNANIPVNGDAELIAALEARGGRGEVLAVGALDREKVRHAVEEILEGSEEAFRRRFEKYGF
jgi:energy-coupling factor transporter ATP-binding protein EcfA2